MLLEERGRGVDELLQLVVYTATRRASRFGKCR